MPNPPLGPEGGENESWRVGGVIIRNEGIAPGAELLTDTLPPLLFWLLDWGLLNVLLGLEVGLGVWERDELAALELRLVGTGMELWLRLAGPPGGRGGERLKSTSDVPYMELESSPLLLLESTEN